MITINGVKPDMIANNVEPFEPTHPGSVLKETGKSANADLIGNCISVRERHASVSVKIVPFHKYRQLQEANSLAHEAMIELRNKGKEPDKSVESAKYAAYNKYDRSKSNDKDNR